MSLCGYQIPERVLYYLLCVDFKDPKEITEWQRKTILNANENASFLEKYLLCGVNLKVDLPKNPVPDVLRGVTFQGGINGTSGIQTLDYCEWDEKTKSFVSYQWGIGTWVGGFRNPDGSFKSSLPILCLTVLIGRLSGSHYHFKFNEEVTKGTITPFWNPCFCVPCLPPCCFLPSNLLECTMEKKSEIEWDRKTRLGSLLSCCSDYEHHYSLKKIIEYQGDSPQSVTEIQPGYDEMVLKSPERVMVMR